VSCFRVIFTASIFLFVRRKYYQMEKLKLYAIYDCGNWEQGAGNNIYV
jgi:hypothetical protein